MKKKLIAFLALASLGVVATLAIVLWDRTSLSNRWQPASFPTGVELSPVEGISIVRLMVPGSGSRGSRGQGNGRYSFEMENYTLRDALQYVEDKRLIEINPLPGGKYNLKGDIAAAGAQQARDLLRKAFETLFQVKIQDESRKMEVLVLECPGGCLQGALPATSLRKESWSKTNNQHSLTLSSTVKGLVEVLEKHHGRIVIDESGIQGAFDFQLDWDSSRPESLSAALEKYGLKLREDERTCQGIFIEKTGWGW